ncbi:hypothetical protein PSAC2689_100055 [Paraburkholderia sacchari]|uniref:transposase n=1 Tax=Paraburkholderia sacchari TaxID=159450 RepID=UPI0039A7380C
MTDLQTDFDFLPLRVIGKSADGKNRYDRDCKRKLIEACQKPGASVAGLALKAGVNANQLRKWISLDRVKSRSRSARQPPPASTPAFVPVLDGPDAESEALEPASALTVDPQPSLEDSLSEEAQMPRKATGRTPGAVKTRPGEAAGQPGAQTPRKASRSKHGTSPEAAQQQSLALNDGADVENIRRANLHVLTSRNGSKTRLGVVTDLSGSNMAHRLHGKKRMDAVEANRFTERLGLPAGWLDTPRSEAEIPASVSQMLAPASRARVSGQPHEPVATATNDDVPVKSTGAKARAQRTRAGDQENPSTVSADVAAEKETTVVGPQDHVNDFPVDVTGHLPEEGGDGAPAATPAAPASLAASAVPQRNPAALPFASVTSLDTLQGIAPIAEALIKTLAGKARTGRLDELKALELLQQAILL